MQTQTPSQDSRVLRGNTGTTTATGTSPATHRRGTSQQLQQQRQEDEKRPRSQGSATATTPSSSGGIIARRQSLVRPSPLKTSTTAGAGASGIATPAARNTATSPRKREIPRPQTSPKKTNHDKTDMPPPPLPRHVRSTSLKQQPSSTSLSSPGGSASLGKQHARHRSQGVTAGDNKATTVVKKGEGEGTPRGKAPFTSYQQQVPPKKTAGSRLAGVSAVGSGAGTTADPDPSLMPSSWPEIAALQTEILHLHLYHSSSLQQHAEWQAESETQLRKKYDSVAETYRAIVNDEKQHQRCLNGQALSTWLRNVEPTAASTSDQIQHLSHIIQDITDLIDPLTGRYTLVLQTFDAWFHKADEIRKCRRQLDSDAAAGLLVFIDPLDDHGWREEIEALGMKLEFCARQLQSLDILGHFGDVGGQEDSALVRVVRGLEELLLGLSKEVAIVKRIERDIVRAERVWVTKITEQFCGDGERSGPSRPREERLGGGLWRSAVRP